MICDHGWPDVSNHRSAVTLRAIASHGRKLNLVNTIKEGFEYNLPLTAIEHVRKHVREYGLPSLCGYLSEHP